jgi:hypothetical protein
MKVNFEIYNIDFKVNLIKKDFLIDVKEYK